MKIIAPAVAILALVPVLLPGQTLPGGLSWENLKVRVAIESPAPATVRAGLGEEALRVRLVRHLREAGIGVAGPEDDAPLSLRLRVSLVEDGRGMHKGTIDLILSYASADGTPTGVCYSMSRDQRRDQQNNLAEYGASAIDRLMGIFLRDFLKANPKPVKTSPP